MFVAILRTTDLNPRVVHLKGGQGLAHKFEFQVVNFFEVPDCSYNIFFL